jgi:hypothetical protein
MQRFFLVSGPVVNQMVLTPERDGWIGRKSGMPRSILLLICSAQLPELHPANEQPARTTVQRCQSPIPSTIR